VNSRRERPCGAVPSPVFPEYRPGSTLFVVWNTGLQHEISVGTFDLTRDARRLFGADGTHVLLIKLSYWPGI
jgi:hypothetical protein